MANFNKERRAYNDGMAFALRIVQQGGIEGLEQELKLRGIQELPLNVSAVELTAVARIRAKEELLMVATASASTLAEHIKMPPSTVMSYLKEFNSRVDLYRGNPEEYAAAQERLNRNIGLNEVCKSYTMEDKEDGQQN